LGSGGGAAVGEKPFLGLETWMPAVCWIRACTANSVRFDLIAGVSLAAFVIPESLAYYQCRAVSGLEWWKGFTTFDCLGIRY
jgi:hypothetical protein